MKSLSLTFRAGAGALKSVKTHGFDIASIGTIAGASGGAKWLVLSQLDRAILSQLVPQLKGPIHLLGSSIGAWRFACYAQQQPLAAIDRFESAYINQSFSARPDIHEITATSRAMIEVVLGRGGATQILSHPQFRTHVMAVRSRHVLASEQRWLLAAGLLTAAGLNAISRRTLGLFFERALFYDARDLPPFFDARGFPIRKTRLTGANLADAVVATGSIPLVLSGVSNIDGAKPGMYRDGGVIDYHHDLPHGDGERLTLYPHFFDRIIPGWFDKHLGWRRPAAAHVSQTILISPSPDFVARLPNGKIPDRTDFVKYTQQERVAAWRTCVAACQEMADDFCEVLETGQLAAHLKAL